MKIIKPSFEIMDNVDGIKLLKNIERYGRICYKTEGKITEESYKEFVKKRIDEGHEAIIEHEKITVIITCDRGVTHEIVRHRIASYSQESTRYCNYSNDIFGNEITVIEPFFLVDKPLPYKIWEHSCLYSEVKYFDLLNAGSTAQEARSVLPNSLKTEIVVTMNLREWRHFFKLRTAKSAHPQMREITIPMLAKFKELIPIIFDNINN